MNPEPEKKHVPVSQVLVSKTAPVMVELIRQMRQPVTFVLTVLTNGNYVFQTTIGDQIQSGNGNLPIGNIITAAPAMPPLKLADGDC